MALTHDNLIAEAISRAARGVGEEVHRITTLDADLICQDALNDLGMRIAGDPARRHLLQASYTCYLDDAGDGTGNALGYCDLSGATYADMVQESIPDGRVVDASEQDDPYNYVPEYNSFWHPLNRNLAHFTLHNKRLYVKNRNDGNPLTVSPPLTVIVNRIPTAAQVPTELYQELFQLAADRLRALMPQQRDKREG